MPAYNTADLAFMQETQQITLHDTCLILAYTVGTLNAYGKPAITYSAGTAVACGWKPETKEVMQDTQVPAWDGRLRLPTGTAVGNKDRIRLTHRYGATLAPAQDYEIIGNPEQGPSGIVLRLKSVMDGS